LILALLASVAFAQESPDLAGAVAESVSSVAQGGDQEASAGAVRLVMALSMLAVLPGLLMVMTPFTRFVVVLALLRQALGLQQSPPNQVLVGLALALTVMAMQPTLNEVQQRSIEPYLAGEMDTTEAGEAFLKPMRSHMLRNIDRADLATSLRLARSPKPEGLDDLPTSVVLTAYLLSELRYAFVIGVKVYIPFLVVDIVVASVLLGMGMMMLPPVVVSVPFKLCVFVLMDGWGLLVTGLVASVVT